jgi:hypothetical protein
MMMVFFSPKLQEHHQVSKIYNFSHFFGQYNPFEKWAFFGLGPLIEPQRTQNQNSAYKSQLKTENFFLNKSKK